MMANVKKEISVQNCAEADDLLGMLHRMGYDLRYAYRYRRYFLLWSDSTVTSDDRPFEGFAELHAPDFQQSTFSNFKNNNNG